VGPIGDSSFEEFGDVTFVVATFQQSFFKFRPGIVGFNVVGMNSFDVS
jgi:hypothetical protein